MVQLIINGTTYPVAIKDAYKCYIKDDSEKIKMADGSIVYELGPQSVAIDYAYEYFEDALRAACLRDLRTHDNLDVIYLDTEANEIKVGTFKCEKWPEPTLAFEKGNVPYWHNYVFTLEEVAALE
jgi:hypothetical protein